MTGPGWGGQTEAVRFGLCAVVPTGVPTVQGRVSGTWQRRWTLTTDVVVTKGVSLAGVIYREQTCVEDQVRPRR